MKKDLKGTLVFDNGGGLTMQLNGTYAHWYQNMDQAAEDFKTYLAEGNTEGWDGHEEDQLDLDPEMDQIQNGGYRVISVEDIIAMTKDEYLDSGWGNVRDFCIALNEGDSI